MPTNAVYRGSISKDVTTTLGQIVQWAIAERPVGLQDQPPRGARLGRPGGPANGGLYLVGGEDLYGFHPEMYWVVPDALVRQRLADPQRDRPADRRGRLVGGRERLPTCSWWVARPRTSRRSSGVRAANIAPHRRSSSWACSGSRCPALKVSGEIGQQLGYLNAAGVATVNSPAAAYRLGVRPPERPKALVEITTGSATGSAVGRA